MDGIGIRTERQKDGITIIPFIKNIEDKKPPNFQSRVCQVSTKKAPQGPGVDVWSC